MSHQSAELDRLRAAHDAVSRRSQASHRRSLRALRASAKRHAVAAECDRRAELARTRAVMDGVMRRRLARQVARDSSADLAIARLSRRLAAEQRREALETERQQAAAEALAQEAAAARLATAAQATRARQRAADAARKAEAGDRRAAAVAARERIVRARAELRAAEAMALAEGETAAEAAELAWRGLFARAGNEGAEPDEGAERGAGRADAWIPGRADDDADAAAYAQRRRVTASHGAGRGPPLYAVSPGALQEGPVPVPARLGWNGRAGTFSGGRMGGGGSPSRGCF